MEKIKFKELPIDDIVKISNERLSKGATLKELYKDFTVGEKTFKSHLNAFGYNYNAKSKRVEPVVVEEVVSVEEFNELKNRVDELFNLVNSNALKPVEGIKEYDGEFVSRNFKIDKDLWNEFSSWCSKNRQYKVQDVINSVLENFLENHK